MPRNMNNPTRTTPIRNINLEPDNPLTGLQQSEKAPGIFPTIIYRLIALQNNLRESQSRLAGLSGGGTTANDDGKDKLPPITELYNLIDDLDRIANMIAQETVALV